MINCDIYQFEDDGEIPNNPTLPLVMYPGAMSDQQNNPGAVQTILNKHGWSGTWVNGIYSYHHYHSTAHEVLVVTGGSASVQFGGKMGEELQIRAGDVVTIPAGVGHCKVNSSMGFQVVGAYPNGQSWDLCTGKVSERPKVLQNIKSVPLPEFDPVTGEAEPLLGYWG
ncbi:cupin domain-containing protein [Aliifodinibius sp. S!AR15-10]|uniref:cupin domain-containing protein n=1 Tax=Aliifodinibius sp. S!AR15-10 TaxID=2950437 RepID=UPI00285CBA55|nr:cupin domain-containing protein [Aliifodinibius sp. S!AR15-10]MDR8393011.1 cupin domain-containing protein [Aliifodinibius sp. S!AR15-10]